MSPAEVDLKTLIEQSRSLVSDILDTSHKLVIEVEAAHYWTTYSLDVYAQLSNITANLLKLLELTQPHWGEGEQALASPEGEKLWKTAVGLWRALPPVRNKLTEQLSRRRRQRIMGQEIEEAEELDPETVQEELARFHSSRKELRATLDKLTMVIDLLPEGLAPLPAQEEEAPAAADTQQKPAAEGPSAEASETATAPADPSAESTEEEPPPAADEQAAEPPTA
jgi:hypothetical protein